MLQSGKGQSVKKFLLRDLELPKACIIHTFFSLSHETDYRWHGWQLNYEVDLCKLVVLGFNILVLSFLEVLHIVAERLSFICSCHQQTRLTIHKLLYKSKKVLKTFKNDLLSRFHTTFYIWCRLHPSQCPQHPLHQFLHLVAVNLHFWDPSLRQILLILRV